MQKYMQVLAITISIIGSFMNITPFHRSIPTTGPVAEAMLKDSYTTDTSLQDFVQSVSNGQRNSVVGVYVPGVLALPIGQQPKGNAGFVTRDPEQATQFSLAAQYGTVGVLAHNDLAGSEFYGIKKDQYAIIVHGDGHLEYYVVDEIQKYQALNPTSTFSNFVNLEDTSETISAGELFSRVYGGGDRLVFQTCIAANGDPSWGRIFIIAHPANQEIYSIIKQTSFVLNFASFGLAAH